MFFSKIVAVFAVAVAAVSVGARPLPLPLQKAVLARKVVPNMEQVVGPVTIIEKRQTVNEFPAEVPSQSKNGVIEPFKGGDVTKRDVPVDVAAKSDGGAIVPFNSKKRDVAVEDAAMSNGGDIVPFQNTQKRDVEAEAEIEAPVEKRQPKINTFPTWIAARSDGGEIVAF